MQRPVTGRVLHDEKAALVVGDMPMPAVPRTVAQGHHVKQFIAAEQGLTKLRHRALAAQFDAQLGSHDAVAAIAADQIVGTQRLDCTAWRSHACADAAGILYEGHQFATEAHCDAGQRLGDRLEQGFKRVLRGELVGLQGHTAVIGRPDVGTRLIDRGVGQAQQGRLVQGQHDIDVHGHIGAQSGPPDFVGNANTAEHFHAACVAAFHFWQELRCLFLLDDGAAYAAFAKIYGEGESDRTGPCNQNLRSHLVLCRWV